jgi:23S rRNA pseudouridine2605 synthase
VIDIVRNACPQRVYPVGRLDRNTTGLLLLTNDGDLSKKISHPSFETRKIYHVFLNRPLSSEDLQTIREGIELEDGPIKPDAIDFAEPQDKRQAGIEIHSGRNRIVRRIFEKMGYKVEKLDRVYFAGLTKKNLPRGKWRFLDEREVRSLQSETGNQVLDQ